MQTVGVVCSVMYLLPNKTVQVASKIQFRLAVVCHRIISEKNPRKYKLSMKRMRKFWAATFEFLATQK